TPGKSQRQRFVERLPAHSYLRHGHICIVVEEGFVTSGDGDIEGVKSADCIFLAEDRNARLDENGVGFSSAACGSDRRIAGDVAVDVELVGIFVQGFTPELSADGKANSAGRQIEKVGRVDGRVDGGQFRSIYVPR